VELQYRALLLKHKTGLKAKPRAGCAR